jgi:hypothetical protein
LRTITPIKDKRSLGYSVKSAKVIILELDNKVNNCKIAREGREESDFNNNKEIFVIVPLFELS